MGIEIIAWELIVLPLLLALVRNMSKKPQAKLKETIISKYKKDYFSKVNLEILQKFGCETFYDKLSKCLFYDKRINQVIERTYKRNANDFNLDDELIEDILNSEIWDVYDYIEAKRVLKYLIQTSFELFNTPTLKTERILSNITMHGTDRVIEEVKDLNKVIESRLDRLSTKIDIISSTDNIPKSVINIISDKRYELVAHSSNENDYFRIEFYVEYLDEMRKFKNMVEYQNYLNFGGVERTFNLVRMVVFGSDEEVIWEYSTKKSDCPMIKLDSILVDSIPILPPRNLESSSHCFLEFSPPQKVMSVDIENETGDKILSNIKFRITRKILEKNKYEVTLQDISSYSKLRVDLSLVFIGTKIVETTILPKMMLVNDAHSKLALYVFIKKLTDSNSILFREIDSNNVFVKASEVEYSESKNNLNNTIDFYKKIIFIQDKMNLSFEIPEKIYRDDEKIIFQLFEILTKGYAIDGNEGFNLNETDKMITDFDALVESGTEVLFECSITYMHLFNKKLEFNRDLFYIVPKALIKLNDPGNYSLVPQAKVMMIYVPVYHKYKISDVIDRHRIELGL